ncbi:tag-273, partial [Pristionchus pacificus]
FQSVNQSIMSDEEDPYAVSSDSEDEKPRKKIEIGAKVDLSSLKKGLTETKEVTSVAKEELEALVGKKEELEKMKKDFEQGTVKKEDEEGEENEVKKAAKEERDKLTQISKEKYSKFKDKFENIESTMGESLEERLKSLANEKELELIEKGQLKSAKERFEKGDSDRVIEKEKIEVARTDEDKKRILSTFNRVAQKDMTADEAPKECAICSKTVYPVERVFVNKKLYHKDCFKCETCAKKLTATNYNCHEGAILCKVHFMAKKHPEMAANLDPANTEEDEREEDDEAFAVSSKPKKLAGDVVRSGVTTTEEELAALRGLGGKKKEEWQKEATETEKADKSTFDASAEIGEGRVKANKERFLTGGANEEEEEEEEGERDPNIVRGDKKTKKEELHFEQVGDIKNKWKTGGVETAEQKEAEGKAELEALKAGGVSVKERFQEGKEAGGDVKKWDRSMLDTSSAAEARKSFIEGTAFDSTKEEGKAKGDMEELQFSKLKDFKERFEAAGQVESKEELERLAIDVAIDLGNLKTAFLKSDEMSPEERAALKKKEIEAEFIRYKLARKAAVQRANEAGEEASVSTAGVGDIKGVFDSGEAFKGGAGEKGSLDVDVKMAGKAREKFQQIDAAGANPVMPGQNKKTEPSKWDKKETSTAEVINRRVEKENTPQDDDEDAFDVKNLMNKFKNIGNEEGKKIDTETRAELEALKSGAKDAKSRFEKGDDEKEKDDEKKKAMQEEFDRLRIEREEAKKKLEEELLEEEKNRGGDKEEVGVAAAHASKMAAKWEKINAKEAKKAEKSKMPEKKGTKWSQCDSPRCPLCSDRVYSAEMIHCFGKPFHSKCFRCSTCKQALRMISARTDGLNLFCQRHSNNTGLSRCQA